jgi:hypothetical protein
MNSTLQSFACSATAPALLSHKDVAHVENAGAVFYLPPASLQSSATAPALLSHKDVAHVENAGAVFYLPPASLQSFAVNLSNPLPLTFIIYSTYLTGKLPVNFP